MNLVNQLDTHLKLMQEYLKGNIDEYKFLVLEGELQRKLKIGTGEYNLFMLMKSEFRNYKTKLERSL